MRSLWGELHGALKSAKLVKVLLQDVGYMDSSGVAVLVKGHKHATKFGVDFRLLDPNPRVMTVLELAQLPKLFHIERTEPDG